jgi:hypothetical protein
VHPMTGTQTPVQDVGEQAHPYRDRASMPVIGSVTDCERSALVLHKTHVWPPRSMDTLGDLRSWGRSCPMPTHRPLWAEHLISYRLSIVFGGP